MVIIPRAKWPHPVTQRERGDHDSAIRRRCVEETVDYCLGPTFNIAETFERRMEEDGIAASDSQPTQPVCNVAATNHLFHELDIFVEQGLRSLLDIVQTIAHTDLLRVDLGQPGGNRLIDNLLVGRQAREAR